MVYKLFYEDGDYQDIDTKEPRNMMEVEIAYTPHGVNIGWEEFSSIEDAMLNFNIEPKPQDIVDEI